MVENDGHDNSTLCHENNIPIKVFNIKSSGDLFDIVSGSNIGTTISK